MAERDLSLGTIFTAQIDQFLRGVRQIRNEVGRLNAEWMRAGTGRATTAMSRAMGDFRTRLAQMLPVNRSYVRSLGEMVTQSDRSSAAIKNAVQFHDKLQSTVAKHAATLNAAGKDGRAYAQTVDYTALKAGVLNGTLRQTSRGFEEVGKAQVRAGKAGTWFAKQMRGIEGAMERLKHAFKVTAAYGIAAQVLYTFFDSIKAGVAEIANFDQALKNLQAITSATDAEIRAMDQTIRDVARSTKFSTTEVADAMVVLGQAGFDAGESMDAMAAIADLSTGTLADMRLTTDLMTTAIRAFNLESIDAGRVGDIFANAVNKSKLTVDKLRIAFNYVGPAAYATGASIEEVAAAMMSLANSGLRASTIGTGMRQVLSRLVAPSARLREAFESHNIALEDLNIRTLGFEGVLENLVDLFVDAKTGAIDSRKAFELFGLRGANAILALVKSMQSGEYKRALESVHEVGTAAQMASIQIEGLALKFKNLLDRLKLIAIEMGAAGLADVMNVFLDVTRAVVTEIEELLKTTGGRAAAGFTVFTGAVYGLVIALAALGKGIKIVWGWMSTMFAGVLSAPIGVLIVAIGALVTAYKMWITKSEELWHKYQNERIQTEKQVTVLESYRKKLREAYQAGRENQELMYKYEALVKRLSNEYKDLGSAIEGVEGNWAEVDRRIVEHMENIGRLNLVNAALAVTEARNVQERTKLTSGFWKATSDGWEQVQKDTEADSKRIDAAIRKAFSGLEDIGEADVLFDVELPEGLEDQTSLVQKLVNWYRELGEETKATSDAALKAQEDLDAMVQGAISLFKTEIVPLQTIVDWMKAAAQQAKMSEADFKYVMDMFMSRVKELQEQAKKAHIIPDLEGVETVFQKIWKDATNIQKYELQKMHKQMEQQISAYREWASKNKDTVKNAEEGVAAIRIQYLGKFYDIVKDEDQLNWKRLEDLNGFLGAMQEAYDTQYSTEIRNSKKTWEARIAVEDEGSTKQLRLIKKMNAELKKLGAEKVAINKSIEEAIDRNTRLMTLERMRWIHDTELQKIRELTDLKIHQEKMDVQLRYQSRKQADQAIADEELRFAQQVFERRQREFEQAKTQYSEDQKEFIQSRNRMIEAQERLNQALEQQRGVGYGRWLDDFRDRFRASEEWLRSERINVQEYVAIVEEGYRQNLINAEEYYRRLAIYTKDWGTAFKQGFEEARQKVETFGEVMYKIGRDLPGVFADNMVDAVEAWVDGSKSMSEAFEDFAKDTLKWIARILMRMLIMKAITGLFGGGTTTSGGIPAGYQPGTTIDTMHKGGVVGKGPFPVRVVNPNIFQNAIRAAQGWTGLRAGEIPAILHKDETVFTKEQMSALGRMISSTLSVHVPVNVEYSDPRFSNALRDEVEGGVLRVLKNQMTY